MNKSIRAVLFDLDGTLLDTAPDLAYAFNLLRKERGLDPLSLPAIRPFIGLGSRPMIKQLLEIEETHPHFLSARARFIELYEQHIADQTKFFPQMENVLTYLENKNIPWGIVTNKLTKHTVELLKNLQLEHRPACIVCGDTLATFKPDPAPILHACKLINCLPQHCLYIGDASTDVSASKAAGTASLVALYGYIHSNDNPHTWQADGYIEQPLDIIAWLQKHLALE